MGPVEAAPEYRVIVDANNLTVEIENELSESQEGQAGTALPSVPHSLSRPHWRAGSQAAFPPGLSQGPAPSPCVSSGVNSPTEQSGDMKRKCISLSWESLEERRLSASY